MEEASQQVQRDRIASASTSPSASSPSSGGRPVGLNLTEQPLLPKDERIVSTNPFADAAVAGPSRDITGQLEPSYSSGTLTTVYPQEQTYYCGGFENSTGNWDDYTSYFNANGLQIVPPAMYNENPSLFFHSGFGVDSQMAYGQFSPMPSPMSPMLMEGQLYSPHQIPVSPYFSQPVSPGLPHVTTPLPISQSDMVAAGSSGQESLGENVLFGPGSGYFLQFGSFGGGLSGEHPLSNRTNSDMASYLPPLSSPSMYPQAIGILGPYEHNTGQISQQRPSHGFGFSASSSSRNNSHGRSYQNPNYSGASISHWGANNQNRLTPDKVGRRDRERNSISISVDSHGTSGDWNRGPRASKTKGKESLSFGIGKNDASTSGVHPEIYNRPDFVTNYENAKFFIIKSFSEDNVHKSIKYNIWASTTLGNRKLDAAYNEAKDMKSCFPVFLLFSVNASGQFCGVAEMVGPVDFENDADYWQQDRWTGQFPVQWHIIKDVPNSQFRHIVLENNDNKPVTHSRDSQEVKLEQGIEMLNIFKEYNAETSILDDFSFYDDREKNLLERKARQRTSLNKNSTPVADASINQLSDSFDEVLELEDGKRSGEN